MCAAGRLSSRGLTCSSSGASLTWPGQCAHPLCCRHRAKHPREASIRPADVSLPASCTFVAALTEQYLWPGAMDVHNECHVLQPRVPSKISCTRKQLVPVPQHQDPSCEQVDAERRSHLCHDTMSRIAALRPRSSRRARGCAAAADDNQRHGKLLGGKHMSAFAGAGPSARC